MCGIGIITGFDMYRFLLAAMFLLLAGTLMAVPARADDDLFFRGGWYGGTYHHDYYPTWDRPAYVYYAPRYYADPIYPTTHVPPFDPPPGTYYTSRYVPNYVAPPDAPPVPPTTYVNARTHNYCREFSQTVRIGDRTQESYGTACLQSDGTWRIVQ
jgi:hypothetical protein